MLSSLSDKSKAFLVYSAVFAVAVCNIAFGLTWVDPPAPQITPAAATAGDPLFGPGRPLVIEAVPADEQSSAAAAAAALKRAPAANAAAEAPAKCDVDACAEAYRSFRASDCTYMPNAGVRRLCTKGNPPQ